MIPKLTYLEEYDVIKEANLAAIPLTNKRKRKPTSPDPARDSSPNMITLKANTT